MKKILLNTESVKEAMAQIVAEKLKFYQGTLQLEVSEDQIYREVEANAIQSMDTIMSNYSFKALSWFSKIIRVIFTTVYDKIIVNEEHLE